MCALAVAGVQSANVLRSRRGEAACAGVTILLMAALRPPAAVSDAAEVSSVGASL